MNTIAYAHNHTLYDDVVERRQQMSLTLAALRTFPRTATCRASTSNRRFPRDAKDASERRRRGGRAHLLAQPVALSLRRPVAQAVEERLELLQYLGEQLLAG